MNLAIALAGILSIYFGYKLFCGLPFRRTRSLVFLNGISGAILAIFGMAILGIDAQSLRGTSEVKSRPAHKPKPTEKGSFTSPGALRHRSSDWFV